jgi:hypothetical protein
MEKTVVLPQKRMNDSKKFWKMWFEPGREVITNPKLYFVCTCNPDQVSPCIPVNERLEMFIWVMKWSVGLSKGSPKVSEA